MATLQPGGLPIIGPLSNFIVYKRHDLDKTIVRTKGGIEKRRIQESPEFENTRRVNSEFGGRATASKWIMRAFYPLKELADYNIAGPINARLKPIQEMDMSGEWGQRNILLTKQPRLLEGFDFNRKNTFDSIIRNPIHFTLTKDTLQASIEVPALLPGINFHVPGRYPMYSLVSSLATLPDLFYTPHGYKPADGYDNISRIAQTDWYPVLNGSPATTLQINIEVTPPGDSFTLMLGIGIRFGTIGADGKVQQLKRAGAAKIIAVI